MDYDLLIYKKLHWYDELPIKKRLELNVNSKFDSRYRPGDIIEVRSAGYYKYHGYNKKAFSVITLRDINIKYNLTEPEYDGDDLKRRRKWNIEREIDLGVSVETKDLTFTDKSTSVMVEKDSFDFAWDSPRDAKGVTYEVFVDGIPQGVTEKTEMSLEITKNGFHSLGVRSIRGGLYSETPLLKIECV